MKTLQSIAGLFVLAACFAWVMVSCTTTTTTIRVTDAKGGMTETVTVTKSADPAALHLAGQVATAYSPRGIVVREEKSTDDIRRILRGRPITKQEIANRWRLQP